MGRRWVVFLTILCLSLLVGMFWLTALPVLAQENQEQDNPAPPAEEAVKTFEFTIKKVMQALWIVVIALFFLASAYFVLRVLFFSHSQEEAAMAKKNLGVTVVGTMVAGGSWIIYMMLKAWLF